MNENDTDLVMGNQRPDLVDLARQINEQSPDPNQRLKDEIAKHVDVRVLETKSTVAVLFSSPVEKINFSVEKARELALSLRQAANRLEKRQRS